MGRPVINLDWEKIGFAASIMCTAEEIAYIFKADADTLWRQCKKKYKCTFKEFLRTRQAKGRMSLRRAQFKIALQGNPRMLQWLGINHLGQTNKVEQKLTGDLSLRVISPDGTETVMGVNDDGRET